jgi:hypothetical protein
MAFVVSVRTSVRRSDLLRHVKLIFVTHYVILLRNVFHFLFQRWQRRWFVLYDDGELSYSLDEHVSRPTRVIAGVCLLPTEFQPAGEPA